MPPSFSYNVIFHVEGQDYEIQVPISHSLELKSVDRFLLRIAAKKSSVHKFRLALRYNNAQEVVSRPISLNLFLSRLDARYLKTE